MRKPKTRHLGLFTPDPAGLAVFYFDVFGMEIVHHNKGEGRHRKGGVAADISECTRRHGASAVRSRESPR